MVILLALIVLAALALALALVGVPWFVWAFAIWVAVAVFGRGGWHRHHRMRRRLRRLGIDEWTDIWPQPVQARPAPAPEPGPARAASDPMERLPLGVRLKIEQIRHKADLLLQQKDRFPMGSKNLYVVERTKAEYLPSTLDAYLALPREYDDRAVAPDGRTGLQVLRDQLDLLDGKLDEIADDVQRQNVDRLLANERFLEEHFGRANRDDDLTIPSS